MSGPKVVRIVTREEILALCKGQLARLDAAVEEWRRVGLRNDTVSDAEIAATESRRNDLWNLLAQERFLDLQKAVPNEIALLQADQEARLAQAAAAAARERTALRRTQSVAAGVLASLDRSGVRVPAELRRQLEAVSTGHSEEVPSISHAFTLLSSTDAPAVTERQRQLADTLKQSDDSRTLEEWLQSQPTSTEDEGIARLDRQIAEVATLLGEGRAEEFADRLRLLGAEPSSSRRSLLEDTLALELAQTLTSGRRRLALQSRLGLLAAELDAAASDACSAMAQSILSRLDALTEALEYLETEGLAVLERARSDAVARERRQAVLTGLAGLGYQVTEGMETAWVQERRVVLRKAMDPKYGVEVGGGIDSERMQFRTVAFRSAVAPADSVRDRDAETIWCNDLAKLEIQLAASGGSIVIERALPAGATPLKVVADPSHTTGQLPREQPAADQQRKLT